MPVATDPAAPDALVMDGEQPPTTSGPVPYAEAIRIGHDAAIPAGEHVFMEVGARAAPVHVPLPEAPGDGQNVYIADASGQAHLHPVTVSPAAGHTIDEFADCRLHNRYAVLHLRFDGLTNWKIL